MQGHGELGALLGDGASCGVSCKGGGGEQDDILDA